MVVVPGGIIFAASEVPPPSKLCVNVAPGTADEVMAASNSVPTT